MIYPKFLSPGDTIGVSAPSDGAGKNPEPFRESLEYLKAQGWNIRETASLWSLSCPSADPEARGREFSSLFEDPSVYAVMAARGGDFLYDCLPYVNFEAMRSNPKWLLGASDPTSLLFTYTVCGDVATMYGRNAGSFDSSHFEEEKENAVQLLKGNLITQHSSIMHASKASFMEDYAGADTPTEWKSPESSIHVRGRCIGGCLEVLKDVIGTKYDHVHDFLKRYEADGFIWYFDDFSFSAESFYLTLLQFRNAGWFDHCQAILIGRVLFPSSTTGLSYEGAFRKAIPDIPYVYEMDIGHTYPSFVMINGAIAEFHYENGKGSIAFELK